MSVDIEQMRARKWWRLPILVGLAFCYLGRRLLVPLVIISWAVIAGFLGLGPVRVEGMAAAMPFVLVSDWLLAAGVIAIILFWERLPLRSIGLRRMNRGDLIWAIGAVLISILVLLLLRELFGPLSRYTTAYAELASLPFSLRIGLLLTVSVTEEIIRTGFPVERLYALTRHLNLSAVAAGALFVLGHVLFFGWIPALVVVLPATIATMVVYVRRRNLFATMIMHLLIDAAILFPGVFANL